MLISENHAPSITKGAILTVDSDVDTCALIHDQFKREGFRVDYCTSYEDLFSIDPSEYSLIIISLDLDPENSFSIVEQIKQQSEAASTAVITCSSNMSPQAIINILNSGADDYLLKPFSIRELTARVKAVLRRA